MKYCNSHAYENKIASDIIPSMRYNENTDFKQWQKDARAKLNELLGLPLKKCDDKFEIKSENICSDYIQKDFEFQSEEGYFVPCSILIPKNISKPIPVSICLQGHSTGMHISLGISKFKGDDKSIAGGRNFAVRAVKEGYCAVTLEQRYMGMCGHDEETGEPSCCTDNTALNALLIGRTAIGERVWDISRLIDVIEKYFSEYADCGKIICMGNSGGGTATFYASCLDERIHLAMPSCSVCTYDDSIMAMKHCCCNFIPGIRKYFDMGDLGGLIAPRKFIMVSGIKDPIFPIDASEKTYKMIESFYDKFGNKDFCHFIKGNAGHQFYPDEAWPVVNAVIHK